MAPSLWVRDKELTAPIRELYATPLTKGEIAFVYFGWAGILLRTTDHVLAFDLCDVGFRRDEVDALARLDVHCYSHTHADHWHAPLAKAIQKRTGVPMVVEPAIAEEGEVPAKDLVIARPGKLIAVGTISLTPITGVHPRPITLFHARCKGPSGAMSLFHGADSGYVPLAGLKADIAFVPTGMPSPSCSAETAVAMVRDLGVRTAVAVHGSASNMKAFKSLAEKEIPNVALFFPKPCELVTVRVSRLA